MIFTTNHEIWSQLCRYIFGVSCIFFEDDRIEGWIFFSKKQQVLNELKKHPWIQVQEWLCHRRPCLHSDRQYLPFHESPIFPRRDDNPRRFQETMKWKIHTRFSPGSPARMHKTRITFYQSSKNVTYMFVNDRLLLKRM